MANVNNPNGLKPLMRGLYGAPVEAMEFKKPATYAKAIRMWDAVTRLSDSTLGDGTDITPGTTLYLGVAMDYAAASVLSYHRVIISPGALYECQGHAVATGIVEADGGANVNLLLTDGPPSGFPVQQSAHELDDSAMDTSIAKDMHLIRLSGWTPSQGPMPGNDFGVHARWEVMFNKHFYHGGVGQAGI